MAEALYRKYRPKKWSEVVGQEHIVPVLEAAVKNGSAAQVYLFTGGRGTGKTSVARILAAALGCESADLVEIDAASNTGVDNIRELQEGVRTLPFASPVKVYIIDEVHMLSRGAFNALLKTLEEPPSHVVFILATTELHKVPETVVSRCEVYHFREPSLEALEKVLLKIAKAEGLKLGREASSLLALLGDGSFRDAIGLLQKVAHLSADKEISREEIEAITAAPSGALSTRLVEGLLTTNLDACLATVRAAVADGKDIRLLLKILLQDIRLIMLYGFNPAGREELAAQAPPQELERWRAVAADKATLARLPSILRELLGAYLESATAAVPSLPLELALINLLANPSSYAK